MKMKFQKSMLKYTVVCCCRDRGQCWKRSKRASSSFVSSVVDFEIPRRKTLDHFLQATPCWHSIAKAIGRERPAYCGLYSGSGSTALANDVPSNQSLRPSYTLCVLDRGDRSSPVLP